jgi:FkbM family methyltransferase
MSAFVSRLTTLLIPLRMAATLGRGGPFSSFRMHILAKSFAVLFGILRNKRRSEQINFWFRGRPISFMVEDSVDFALIREVFLDEEYDHPRVEGATRIFDVGANAGAASLYFHALYPDATIYAFEPNPALFTKLAGNIDTTSAIVALPYALSDHDGEVAFYTHPTSTLAGTTLIRKEATPITVPARRLSTAARELCGGEVDIVKFDIEGGERDLFSSPEDRAVATLVIGEVHLDLLGLSEESFANLFPEFSGSFVRRTGPKRRIYRAVRERRAVSSNL